MITAEIYEHVKPAVQLILADLNGQLDPNNIEQQVYTKLWPYVSHAVHEVQTPTAPTPEKADGRSKTWQLVVRFWEMREVGPYLAGETDPEMIVGTGKLPALVSDYAEQLHEVLPLELAEEKIKPMLAQLRNNLGRQGKAVLRIEYRAVAEDGRTADYLCQVDVAKP